MRPMSVEARAGYCYFLTFTDDLSRYGYIYLMKQKSETFEKFKEFQSEVENHRNKKIKFLQSDRGGEYLSYKFGLHLKQCQIVSQHTPPGTPQRNCHGFVMAYVLVKGLSHGAISMDFDGALFNMNAAVSKA